MASIIKKKVKKYTYYYLVESARVNGKPRIVNQKYLGSAKDIGKAIDAQHDDIPEPEYSTVLDFGAVVALYDLAERLGIGEIINKHTHKRNQGLSIGEYLLLAAINRAVEPTSKKEFFNWFDGTVLHKFFPAANKKSLSSQGFWDNMSMVDENMIKTIEEEITRIVAEKYKISTECLVYDTTNFFTYMDTANPATLAKRGNSKQKRTDLKIIGLAMMVSPDSHIPLFHETYPGNTNDARQFAAVIERLKERFMKISNGQGEITLVYDKGNNSDPNIEEVLSEKPCRFHVVGGLRLSQCQELLEIPQKEFTPLQGGRFKGATVYRTRQEMYQRTMTVLVTYNLELIEAQLEGIHGNIEKCKAELQALQTNLEAWEKGDIKKGRKPTTESVGKKIAGILSVEHMRHIFDYHVGEEHGIPMITFSMNTDKIQVLKERVLGKSILYTDHEDWDNEKIVATYRSQYHIEDCFKQMKDKNHLGFRPLYHWTDAMVRVHAFYCVLALLLCSILNRELEKLGHKNSINRMLSMLQEVQQVITVFPKKRGKVSKSSFSKLDGDAKQMIEKLDLMKYQLKL